MNYVLLFTPAVIVILVFIWKKFFNSEIQSKTQPKPQPGLGEEIAEELEKLGYFKYAKASDIPELKHEIVKDYYELQILSTAYDEETGNGKEYRYHHCDGEDLFEQGGIITYLEVVKPTFEKMGLKLEWSDEKDIDDGDYWEHTIKLNGQEYIAFKGKIDYNAWGIAAKNFAVMLNDQLEKQGSDERVYLISGGNDGNLVFLTSDQYNYIRKVYPYNETLPLPVEEWSKINKL